MRGIVNDQIKALVLEFDIAYLFQHPLIFLINSVARDELLSPLTFPSVILEILHRPGGDIDGNESFRFEQLVEPDRAPASGDTELQYIPEFLFAYVVEEVFDLIPCLQNDVLVCGESVAELVNVAAMEFPSIEHEALVI